MGPRRKGLRPSGRDRTESFVVKVPLGVEGRLRRRSPGGGTEEPLAPFAPSPSALVLYSVLRTPAPDGPAGPTAGPRGRQANSRPGSGQLPRFLAAQRIDVSAQVPPAAMEVDFFAAGDASAPPGETRSGAPGRLRRGCPQAAPAPARWSGRAARLADVATTSSSNLSAAEAAKGATANKGRAAAKRGAAEAARPLVLLDGHSLAYRAFFALPSDLATTTGQATNAVYGFTLMLVKLFGDFVPDRIAVCFDAGMPAFRSDLY